MKLSRRISAVTGSMCLFLSVGLMAGCSSNGGDQGKTLDMTKNQIEGQEKQENQRLENLDHLPPQARAAALKQRELQKNAARQAAAAQTSNR